MGRSTVAQGGRSCWRMKEGKKHGVQRQEDGADQGGRGLAHHPGWSLGGWAVPLGQSWESPGPRDCRGSLAAPQPAPWRKQRLPSQKDYEQPGFGAIPHPQQFQECAARGEGRGLGEAHGVGVPRLSPGKQRTQSLGIWRRLQPTEQWRCWLVGDAHCLPGTAVTPQSHRWGPQGQDSHPRSRADGECSAGTPAGRPAVCSAPCVAQRSRRDPQRGHFSLSLTLCSRKHVLPPGLCTC